MKFPFPVSHILISVVCLSPIFGIGCGPWSHRQSPVPRGKLSFQFVVAFGTAGSGPGEFLDPKGLCLDPLGNLYVADTGNDRIQKFDAEGRFLAQIGSFGWERGRFNKPTDVAVRTSLHLYVVDSQNRRIQAFDAELEPLAEITGDFGLLAGIAISSHGDIYITDTENSRLIKINPFGRVEGNFAGFSTGTETLLNPTGLALNKKGYIYVCDPGNNRIAIFDQFGNFLFCFGETVVSEPEGISINSLGEVFVADTGAHQVLVFDEKGNLLRRLGTKGIEEGFFRVPRDVAANANFLFVLDSGNSRVQKFRLIRTMN
ncbi:MAG: hypothetical protein DRQ24_00285 [Candidatus Latescibacterota bacterium]|nr:MAG: hypothetical protein DRQ24_00285 [Candidatus Latescibacterota bacterium]